MMTRVLLVLLMMALPSVAAAAIYRWVDENGKVHFSQHPPKVGPAEAFVPGKPASTIPPESAPPVARPFTPGNTRAVARMPPSPECVAARNRLLQISIAFARGDMDRTQLYHQRRAQNAEIRRECGADLAP